MLRPLQLPDNFSGKLWLSSMPGRFESLEEFLEWCQAASVDEIVCLVEDEEIAYKCPDYAFVLKSGRFPIPVERFPILDYGVPDDLNGFVNLARQVANHLRAGGKIVLHCAAGYGRTGMVAVMVLRAAGMSPDAALAAVQAAGSSPETAAQRQLLERLSI